MAQNSNSIPIRVIPGNTELVKDTSTGAFHLNVGFHLSFNVKELMQTLAKMTDVDVTIKAESSVPISGQQSAQTMQQPAQKEKEPPQKKNDEKRSITSTLGYDKPKWAGANAASTSYLRVGLTIMARIRTHALCVRV